MQSLELQVNLLLEEEVDEGTRQLWLKTFSVNSGSSAGILWAMRLWMNDFGLKKK